jgi:hypothetical protein
MKNEENAMHQNTYAVRDKVFQQVYDAPSSLPGKYKCLTSDKDKREMEKILGMP